MYRIVASCVVLLSLTTVHAQETPTVFSLAGSVLKITGGRNSRIGGNAIYVYSEVEPDGSKTFVMQDFSGHDLNVAGPGCVVDPADPSYLECPADGLRSLKVRHGPNPLNDFFIVPSTDPQDQLPLQYPGVVSIQIKSSGDETELLLPHTSVTMRPIFPGLTKLQIKTRNPFVLR